MMDTPSRRTPWYLVNRRFQVKYALFAVGMSAVIYGVLGYLLYQKELANSRILQIQNPTLQQLVEAQDYQILYWLLGFFFLQVVLLFVLGIVITHRIAGPIRRVHRYFEEVAEKGEMPPLGVVRKGDEFQPFFESLHEAAEVMQTKKREREQALQKLEQALLRAEGDANQFPGCRALLEKLR